MLSCYIPQFQVETQKIDVIIIVFHYSQLSPLALTVGRTLVQNYAHLSCWYLRNQHKPQCSY